MSLLEEFILPKKVIPIKHLKNILIDILTCLKFLKINGIIHCDLKPENLLYLSGKGKNVKIIDFGSATFINDTAFYYLQTRPYRAPEVIFGCEFDFSVDMWSVGCIIYELLTSEILFNHQSAVMNFAKALAINKEYNIEFFKKGVHYNKNLLVKKYLYKANLDYNNDIIIPKNDFCFKESLEDLNIEPDLIDFIQKCLLLEPKERLTPEKALNHPFLKK